MTALAVARASLRRIVTDRTALFFLVVLPIIVILVVGVTIRGFDTFRVAVVDQGAGPLGTGIIAELEADPAFEVDRSDDLDASRTALRRAEHDLVVVLPPGMDADLRSGAPVEVVLVGEQANTSHMAARVAVAAVVARHGGLVQAATFATEHAGGDLDQNLGASRDLRARLAPVGVQTETVDGASDFLPMGFGYSTPTMLVLFVFINGMAAGAALIESRQLGVHARVLAAPVTAGMLIRGELLAYLTIALGQSTLIVVLGAGVFGVDWGDPLAAAALVAVWALVGTGAGLLSGAVFRTPEQAGSIGPALGIALAMLGGALWPLEIVPRSMQLVGRSTPHGWAVDGWIELLSRDGDILAVAGHLAVLAGFAAALLTLATTRLRSRLVA